MAGGVTVKVDITSAKRVLEDCIEGFSKNTFLDEVTSEFLTEMIEYLPYRDGGMTASATKTGHNRITVGIIYANRFYTGNLTPITFTHHPKATTHWDEHVELDPILIKIVQSMDL